MTSLTKSGQSDISMHAAQSGSRRLAAQDLRQGGQQPVSACARAHGYSQIVGDERRGKMADDHGPLAQRGGQRRARMRGMTREDEVGGGRQHFEAKPDQSAV